MATIAFQMTSTPLTGTKTFTGTDQDMQDLLDWAKAMLIANGQLTASPDVTNAQIGAALAQNTINAWKQAVKKFKDDAALAAVTPTDPMTWA